MLENLLTDTLTVYNLTETEDDSGNVTETFEQGFTYYCAVFQHSSSREYVDRKKIGEEYYKTYILDSNELLYTDKVLYHGKYYEVIGIETWLDLYKKVILRITNLPNV